MRYIKSYILFVIMGFAVAGCTMDDLKDDVNDLKDRVTLIEQQVKLLNDNLAVIGYILDPQNKTVSKVETVKENGVAAKYVITLSDNTQLTEYRQQPRRQAFPLLNARFDLLLSNSYSLPIQKKPLDEGDRKLKAFV